MLAFVFALRVYKRKDDMCYLYSSSSFADSEKDESALKQRHALIASSFPLTYLARCSGSFSSSMRSSLDEKMRATKAASVARVHLPRRHVSLIELQRQSRYSSVVDDDDDVKVTAGNLRTKTLAPGHRSHVAVPFHIRSTRI